MTIVRSGLRPCIVSAALAAVAVAGLAGCGRAKPLDPTTATAADYFPDPLQLRLAEAVARGDVEAISDAVRRGANVDKAGRDGLRMLMWAMLKGSVSGYRALLDHDANVLAAYFNPQRMKPVQSTRTVAELTAAFSDKAFLHAMLEHGFDPNTIVRHKTGETLLFYMVWKHDLEGAAVLLNAGADVNQRDSYGDTPLHLAVVIRDYRMANTLCDRGADPTLRNSAKSDVCAGPRFFGSRGVTPEQEPAFEQFVVEMERRGLITREDIAEADKPKGGGAPGVTIVEHSSDSPMGRAIKEMDRRKQEADSRRGR